MVSDGGEGSVYGFRLSSVVPATVTGEDKVDGLSNMDLAMKLHYLKGVYFFRREAVEGLTISDLKKPMFEWLKLYYPTAGRIRRSESGRPMIKCNDGGVRIVEAQCEKSVDEWMAMEDHDLHNCLTYDQVLGPDLAFSPLVFIQLTWFKCGAMSVGLSWAHVQGDVVSASDFINMWGSVMAGHAPPRSLGTNPTSPKPQFHQKLSQKPFSLKMTHPVGDHWLLPRSNHPRMGTRYFHVTLDQLERLLSAHSGPHAQSQPFQLLSAIMWKTLAKIQGESAPKIVTVCRNSSGERGDDEILKNAMVVSRVEADIGVAEADVSDLARLIAEKTVCENGMIEETVGGDDGKSDFILYGANLTFINFEEVKLFGLEIKGHKPVWASYSIGGVGDEGAFLVLPAQDGDGGRTVTAILPENQLAWLRRELKDEWGIA
ncbi:hypothetical protein PVL29_023527 [Vitis rotundifolia]|uniref:Uncharacterized protein n=1 Tax=Vitis rotundifolia TaxID=103349 RepID=A0AA38YP18_VITRO|nr:hypothetical protein PVL29_023527 [Vitis rotundifolia]